VNGWRAWFDAYMAELRASGSWLAAWDDAHARTGRGEGMDCAESGEMGQLSAEAVERWERLASALGAMIVPVFDYSPLQREGRGVLMTPQGLEPSEAADSLRQYMADIEVGTGELLGNWKEHTLPASPRVEAGSWPPAEHRALGREGRSPDWHLRYLGAKRETNNAKDKVDELRARVAELERERGDLRARLVEAGRDAPPAPRGAGPSPG